MALELKIPITADANSAISGLNDTADSASKLFRKFAEGKATLEQFERQLGEDIAVAASKAGYGLKGMEAQYKGLLNFMERSRQKWGKESEIYKDITASADYAKSEISRLKLEEEGLTGATNAYATAVKNAAPAVDKFATATKELDSTSKSYLTRLVTLTKNILTFQLIMGPIRSAVSGVRNTLKDSTKTAAEAEQIYSKLTTVFDNFEDSARRASVALASSIGVAQSTASSALSTVGDLLQAQGMGTAQSLSKASSWVKQFQDIIAFKDINMTLEEFAQNFMSGAAGNLRNFRTFGSIVKESAVNARLAAEGLDKLTGSQLELAKMTTRATMALEQQKNAVGATEREWDTMLSVNRRLSESWKEYKENLGDTINSVLKPMKRYFADMLNEANKVKRAAKELKNGALTSSVYNISGNEKDFKTFKKNVLEEFNTYEGDYTKLSRGTIGAEDTLGIEALDYVLRMFNASVYDLAKVLGDKLPLKAYELLSELEKQRKEEEQLLKDIDNRKTTIATMADSFSAFQEALLGITGVNFDATDISHLVERGSGSDIAMNGALGIIGNLTFQSIDKALASLNTDDLAATFGDVISGALDDLDEAGLREAQVESLRKLFESSWNQFAEGGFTDEEKAKLEEIKTSYKEATAALEEYNKKLQIQNSILSFKSGLGSIETQTRQIGMTDEQKALDDLRMSYHELTKDANLMTNEELDELELSYNRQIVAIRTLYKLQNEYNSKLEREAAIKSYIDKTADYRTQLANIGLTDRQIEYNRMNEEARAAWNSGDMDLYKTIVETIQAFNDLNVALDEAEEAEKRRAALEDLMDKVNPFASTMEAYSLGQSALGGGVMAGIAGVLADILANTEAFQKLASIVTDHIVPVLDAFLEPLLPVIDVIGDLMQSLVQGILVPMFPLIVEICALVTLVVGTIKNIADLIVNTIKKVIGSLGYGIMRALDKLIIGDQSHWYEGTWMDQWRNLTPWETFKTAQEQLLDQVKEIRGLTFDIKENTDDKDLLATLKELYSRGIIDESQFYAGARVKQKDMIFDPVSPSGDHYITNGDITIYVNGGDPAELRRTLEQFFDENNMHYNMAYGRA